MTPLQFSEYCEHVCHNWRALVTRGTAGLMGAGPRLVPSSVSWCWCWCWCWPRPVALLTRALITGRRENIDNVCTARVRGSQPEIGKLRDSTADELSKNCKLLESTSLNELLHEGTLFCNLVHHTDLPLSLLLLRAAAHLWQKNGSIFRNLNLVFKCPL